MEQDRRGFLRWIIHGLGAVFAVVFGFPVVAYLIDARHRHSKGSGYREVEGIRLNELVLNQPRQGVIRNVRADAWTLHPTDVVGRVWVVKVGPGEDDIRVLSTTCPHLGCSVNYTGDEFLCPCHGGRFRMDGSRPAPEASPAPRDMDMLETWRRDPSDPTRLQVVFERFRANTHEKVKLG